MTTSDKKKTQVLLGLLVVAGLTWVFAFKSGDVRTTPRKDKKKPMVQRTFPDATIRLELLDDAARLGAIGQNDIFRYRQKPLAASLPGPAPIPPAQSLTNRAADVPPQPPAAPPGKAWKYEGFTKSGDKLVASLTEGNTSYPVVTLGDCLMGVYCVRSIAENVIEIEDLQLRQLRSFQRVQ
jgi:hypothetical protein